MKIGDKVYCIKEYQTYYPKINFEIGKTYNIEGIIEFDRLGHHTHKANVNKTLFTLLKDSNIGFHLSFYEYFITEKELRKIKLQKIINHE